jgi:hypothetical protein
MAKQKRASTKKAGPKLGPPKATVKGFRAERGEPTFIRFINPASDVTEIDVKRPYVLIDDRIEIAPPEESGASMAIEFDVALTGTTMKTIQRARSLVVEITSGSKRYRETIMPEVRRQALRYHLMFEEPGPDFILCPRHGLVRPVRGHCPEAPPHL